MHTIFSQAEAIELPEGTSLASTFAPPIYLQSFFSNYKLAGVLQEFDFDRLTTTGNGSMGDEGKLSHQYRDATP